MKFQVRFVPQHISFYFVVLSDSGEELAMSRMYKTKTECYDALKTLKRKALFSSTEDVSLVN